MTIKTTLGIIIIGCGTILMLPIFESNYIPISGAIIITIGTFITTWSQYVENKKRDSELFSKIQVFEEKLDNVKHNPNINSINKVGEIEEEFTNWLTEFNLKKEEHIISSKQESLKLEKERLELNRNWIYLYKNTIEIFEQILITHNKIFNNLEFHFPEVPNNFYLPSFYQYVGKVKYGPADFIYVLFEKPRYDRKIPVITFSISKKNVELSDEVWLYTHSDKQLILSFDIGKNLLVAEFNKKSIEEKEYPLNINEIKSILKAFWEHAIIYIEANN